MPRLETFHSILKFFQVDITGMFRMTSCARYFKAGVGSSRPNWRWIMCFVERPKTNTSWKALVKRLRIVGRHQRVNDIDEALHVHVCS